MQSTIMPSTQMAVKEYGYFAGNQWRNAVDNQVFEVHEPYSGRLFARVAATEQTFPTSAETLPQNPNNGCSTLR